jgi:hypothetical protein
VEKAQVEKINSWKNKCCDIILISFTLNLDTLKQYIWPWDQNIDPGRFSMTIDQLVKASVTRLVHVYYGSDWSKTV